MCHQKLFFTSLIAGGFIQMRFPPEFEVQTSVCFRWSPCFPGSSCTTPSRWGGTTTATTSTRGSRSTSAPLRTTRGPSHITTAAAAACRSDRGRNQRLLKGESSSKRSGGRPGQETVDWQQGHTPVAFSTFLGHHQDFRTDYAKKTGSLGVCIVKKSVEFQRNAPIRSHWFGSVNRR